MNRSSRRWHLAILIGPLFLLLSSLLSLPLSSLPVLPPRLGTLLSSLFRRLSSSSTDPLLRALADADFRALLLRASTSWHCPRAQRHRRGYSHSGREPRPRSCASTRCVSSPREDRARGAAHRRGSHRRSWFLGRSLGTAAVQGEERARTAASGPTLLPLSTLLFLRATRGPRNAASPLSRGEGAPRRSVRR